MGIIDTLKDNPLIIIGIMVALWWVRQSPTPNPMILSILEALAKFFKVPMPGLEQVRELQAKLAHSHDISTADGICCAVDDLCVELESVGQKQTADSLNASLPLLVSSRRRKNAA